MLKALSVCTMLGTLTLSSYAQPLDTLRQRIQSIIATKKADVGVAIRSIDGPDTLTINGSSRYPMQSVFKLHIALAVLDRVDRNELQLNQKVRITPTDLLPNTWSPIRDRYPSGNVALPLADILQYTVAWSDNNGCDILLRLIGGPSAVNSYVHSKGITDVAIAANEEQMHASWNVQFDNWTTPGAAADLLVKLYNGIVVSDTSFAFIRRVMEDTVTGEKRIKGGVPAGTVVAHKTGTSGTNEKGIAAATNDIGVVQLPNGKRYAIAVLVANSTENSETNEQIIAEISRAAWEYFKSK